MTDLTKLLENFYRDIINDIYSYSLKNANEGRSNAPGLDLIDDVRGIGIQVTSQVIRVLIDQNPLAHSLRPIDMIRHGWGRRRIRVKTGHKGISNGRGA